ncbi:MAG: hypothetical protein U0S50_06275 [Sphingopyxis sp.]|uniref:hypothetical protein n=1 Tax=Sphingopyxis sp. TaxID=1908224 RepID=UPI002AB8A8A6|nr:hypothetical protein [Sphingopyxis sp.]MDZ3831407.1 hypothetical protein [Sphingopyxis sp.]
MNKISVSQAWSYATSFFSGQMANHAIVLIGVGIFVPMLLNMLFGGGAAALSDPMAYSMAAMSGAAIVVGILGYILQTGSYFASWRIGLTDGAEPIGGALAFGVVASLPVLLLGLALALVFGLVFVLIFGGAMLPMLMGGGTPGEGALASMGLMVLVLVPAMLFLFVWLAARFCCTGPIMADRRTYNVLTGLGESWRLTAASQWKLCAYFVLLGVVMFVMLGIVGMIAGVSMVAGGASTGGIMTGVVIGSLLVGIPMAFLQVGVPAGIYRALGGDNPAAAFA